MTMSLKQRSALADAAYALYDEGDRLFAAGDIAAARAKFTEAANHPGTTIILEGILHEYFAETNA